MTVNRIAPSDSMVTLAFADELKQKPLDRELTAALRHLGLSSPLELTNHAVKFDLSRTYWYDLGALLWTISLMHRLKAQGNDLTLRLPDADDPKGDKTWDFLLRWRFFDALRACVDEPVNLLDPDQFPLTSRESRYSQATVHDEQGRQAWAHTDRILEIDTIAHGRLEPGAFADDEVGAFLQRFKDVVIIAALARYCGWTPEHAREFVNLVLAEGLTNSMLHAAGTFSLVGMRLDGKYLALAIADNGIGIPDALRAAFTASPDRAHMVNEGDVDLIDYFSRPEMVLDTYLIDYSTRRGTSSIPGRSGVGLYYLKDTVLTQGGELRVRSGRASVTFRGAGLDHNQTDDQRPMSPGTTIRVLLPLASRRL
jgi:hypothetical protein